MSSGAYHVSVHKSLPTRSFNDPSNIEHIVLIRDDANSLGWIRSEFIELLHKSTKHGWRNRLFPTQYRTSAHRASAIEHFDATYHDSEAESRRRGDAGAEA